MADATYSIEIAGEKSEIAVVEYKGQRVLTLAMMDALHQRPEGTARRNFNDHKNRLVEGEDYFKVCADEIRTHKILKLSPKAHEDVTLLTETGYSMVVKPFNDDLAWEVQRQLVNGYFKAKETSPTLPVQVEAFKLMPTIMRAARCIGLDKNAAAISASQALVKMTGVNVLALLGATHLETEKQVQFFTPTDLGARIGVSARKFNMLLAEAGLQAKRGETWVALDTARDFVRLFDTGKRHGDGTPVTQMKWAENVLELVQPAAA